MDAIGHVPPMAGHADIAIDAGGPIVLRGDAVISRLLFLRDRWDLGMENAALSSAETVAPDPTSPEGEWLREWHHAWNCLDDALFAWARRRQAERVPDVLHPDWFGIDDARGEDPGYASAAYQAWVASHSSAGATSGYIEDPAAARAAAKAAQRGLIAIVVVPVEGAWHGRTRHLLGASPVVFDSGLLLRRALGVF